jgi:hypothetical protein
MILPISTRSGYIWQDPCVARERAVPWPQPMVFAPGTGSVSPTLLLPRSSGGWKRIEGGQEKRKGGGREKSDRGGRARGTYRQVGRGKGLAHISLHTQGRWRSEQHKTQAPFEPTPGGSRRCCWGGRSTWSCPRRPIAPPRARLSGPLLALALCRLRPRRFHGRRSGGAGWFRGSANPVETRSTLSREPVAAASAAATTALDVRLCVRACVLVSVPSILPCLQS